jgi:hypothetical protein
MADRIAKPVVKDKFWVVEDHGTRVATIQATVDGGFVYVHDDEREHIPSLKVLKQKYNIKFGAASKPPKEETVTVYGYPIAGRSYNQVYDVQKKLPVYSKTPKSRSMFCAGYYLVKINQAWIEHFCPKNITLNRYSYLGPFKTEQAMKQSLKEQNAKS